MKPRAVLVLILIAVASAIPRPAVSQGLAERVKEFQLKNGMQFIVVERPAAPVFFAAIAFNVGSADEAYGATGISHFLEHMMFKGTRKIGTTSYDREKQYLEEEDRLATSIADKRREIGPWRTEIFDGFARELMASLSEETRQAIGSDKRKELEALVELLEAGQRLPPEADRYPTLLEEGGVGYLDKYTQAKQDELKLARVQEKHKDYIVEEEFWDIYTREGGRMLNAFTSTDITAYIVYLPSNRLELWMAVEADRLAAPVFREAYQERDVVTEEIRLGQNDPEEALWDALMAAAFQASPYGRPIAGWMSDVRELSRADLEAHYRRHYAPNNAVAILVGDLDAARVERLARAYFGGIPAQPALPPLVTREPEQMGERRVTVEHTANPQVLIGYHVPAAPHPDYYSVQVLVAVLGDGRTSRLYEIYEKMQLTAEPPAVYTGPGDKMDNLLIIEAKPRAPHTADEVERAVYAKLDEIGSVPPTDHEIQRVRNKIDADMVRTLGSNAGIAFSLGFAATVRGDWRAYLADNERVKQVTAGDVSSVAAKYLVGSNRTVATLVGPEPEGGRPVAGAVEDQAQPPPKAEKDREQPPAKAKEDRPKPPARAKAEPPRESPREPPKESQAQPAEPIDLEAVVGYVRTLSETEQREIFERMQQMDPEERKQLVRQLHERMKAAGEMEARDGK